MLLHLYNGYKDRNNNITSLLDNNYGMRLQMMAMNDARDDNERCKIWQWMMQDMAMNDARDDNE